MAAVKDICPELIQDVNRQFQKNCLKDVEMKKLSEKAQNGTATYADAYRYAESVGSARADAFKSQISAEVLPDGRMYYNIAERLMTDSLTADHDMVATFAEEVQKAINENAGMHIKAQRADVDEDRIDGFVQRLASADNYDDVAWITQEPIRVHARSVVDDTIKKNAEFQHKAGIRAEIKRDSSGDCCKWCDGLVGEYTYPGVPREVFARHDNCRCTLDYNGRRLTAYESGGRARSFRDQGEQEKIEARKEYAQRVDEKTKSKQDNITTAGAIEKGYTNSAGRIGTNEVDMDYIRSQEYRSKFDKLSGDSELNEYLYKKAIKILDDNKGTDTETTVIVSNHKTIVNKRGEKDSIGVSLSPGQIGMLKNKKDLVGLHNHPTNLPPNGTDFAAAGSRKYGFGVIVTHDRNLYKYSVGDIPFAGQGLNNLIDKYSSRDYNLTVKEAYDKAINEYKERFGISCQLIE